MSWPLHWLFRAAVFFLAFAIDVRVRAESLHYLQMAQIQLQPEQCWQTSVLCAARTRSGQSASGEFNQGELNLDADTTLVRVSDSQLRLVSGQIWISGVEASSIRTEFGELQIEPESEAWIEKNQDRVRVAVIKGKVWLKPLASHESIEVGPGLQNWLGRVSEDLGHASSGAPTVPNFAEVIRKWGSMYHGKKEEFAEEASDYREAWLAASQQAAEIHQQLFERKCASIDESEHEKTAHQQKVEARRQQLLRIFRQHLQDD